MQGIKSCFLVLCEELRNDLLKQYGKKYEVNFFLMKDVLFRIQVMAF